jgi:hypothetical protein
MGEAARRKQAGAKAPGGATTARRRRAKNAWSKRDQWNKVLSDVYTYVAPHRRSNRLAEGGVAAKTDRIFDNHASVTLARVVGRLMEDVFPSGSPFFALEPGPAVAKDDERDKARAELETISEVIHASFQNGDFDDAASGMFTDGLVSTGFMLVLKGDAACPVLWLNVPHDEVAVDSGPYSRLHGFFWKRKWTRRAISEAFPEGKFDEDFVAALDTDKAEELVTLCQDTLFDAKSKKWKLYVYLEKQRSEAGEIHTEEFETCPWVAFRYFKLPGEDYGFGPVLMNLPIIKTLNKVAELALKGAALNALGIFTRIDDGVFNPDTARLEPGAMWAVARNGGPLGPSIARLDNSSDPNLNMLSINDMRMSVSAGMSDEQLPPDGQSPRSAAEIIARTRRLRQNHAGAFSRIVHDVILAILPRVQEILKELGVLRETVKIDNLLVKIKIVSPLGAAFRARRAETYAEWAQVALALGGPEALRMATPLERSLVEMGYDMGVPAAQLNSPSEQDMLAQRVREGVAAALERMKGKPQQPPPANGDPAQAMAA